MSIKLLGNIRKYYRFTGPYTLDIDALLCVFCLRNISFLSENVVGKIKVHISPSSRQLPPFRL